MDTTSKNSKKNVSISLDLIEKLILENTDSKLSPNVSENQFLWKASKMIPMGQKSFQESDSGPLVIDSSERFDNIKAVEQQISKHIYPQIWGKVFDIQIFSKIDPKIVIKIPDIISPTKYTGNPNETDSTSNSATDNHKYSGPENYNGISTQNIYLKRSARTKRQTDRYTPDNFSPKPENSSGKSPANNVLPKITINLTKKPSQIKLISSGKASPLNADFKSRKASYTIKPNSTNSFTASDKVKNSVTSSTFGLDIGTFAEVIMAPNPLGTIPEPRNGDSNPNSRIPSFLIGNVKKSILDESISNRAKSKSESSRNLINSHQSSKASSIQSTLSGYDSGSSSQSSKSKENYNISSTNINVIENQPVSNKPYFYDHSRRSMVPIIDNSKSLSNHTEYIRVSNGEYSSYGNSSNFDQNKNYNYEVKPKKQKTGKLDSSSRPEVELGRDSGLYTGRSNDYCDACKQTGKFICCDACPRVFHFLCAEPPVDEEKAQELDHWFCSQCLSKRQKSSLSTKASKSIMAPLLERLIDCNPRTFSVPQEIKQEFSGIKLGTNGEFELSNRGKVIKGAANLDRDFNILVDANGQLVFCYRCDKTALHGSMIQCDYCRLSWHLDCLFPFNTSPPTTGQKWMCPNHLDNLKTSRKFKSEILVDQSQYPASAPNNGNIDVIEDRDASRLLLPVDDPRLKFQVPQSHIEDSFFEVAKQRSLVEAVAWNIKKSNISKREWLESILSFQQQVANYLIKSESDGIVSGNGKPEKDDPKTKSSRALSLNLDPFSESESDPESGFDSDQETGSKKVSFGQKYVGLKERRELLEDPLVLFAAAAIKLLCPPMSQPTSTSNPDFQPKDYGSLIKAISDNINKVSQNVEPDSSSKNGMALSTNDSTISSSSNVTNDEQKSQESFSNNSQSGETSYQNQ